MNTIKLPTWEECRLIINNYEGNQEGKKPTALHHFIYDYDDAEEARSLLFFGSLESLLSECRKHALLEATEVAEYYAMNSSTARSIRDELRRMAEGEKK